MMSRFFKLTIAATVAALAVGVGLLLQAEFPQVPTGTWAPAGLLADARAGSGSALLDDGRVLIIGGTGAAGPLATRPRGGGRARGHPPCPGRGCGR